MTDVFLKDNNCNSIALNDNDGVFILVKVKYNSEIYFLYKQHNYRRKNLAMNDKLDFWGLYHMATETFYFNSSYDLKFLKDIGLNSSSIEDVRTGAIGAIREKIHKLINHDLSNLPPHVLKDKDLEDINYNATQNARKHFIFDTEIDKRFYANKYGTDYHFEFTTEDIIKALINTEAFIETKARKYIDDNIHSICYSITLNNETAKEMEKLSESGLYDELKKIIAAINGDYLTINVEILKEDKPFTFKMENSLARHFDSSYISTWGIKASDRKTFESLYGRHSNFTFNDIQRIAYGRKALYQR